MSVLIEFFTRLAHGLGWMLAGLAALSGAVAAIVWLGRTAGWTPVAILAAFCVGFIVRHAWPDPQPDTGDT